MKIFVFILLFIGVLTAALFQDKQPKSNIDWRVSSVFDYPITTINGQEHIYKIQGVQGRLGFTPPNMFRVNQSDKHMWFFWGNKKELLGQNVKVLGVSKQTGETVNVFAGNIDKDYLNTSVDGKNLNMPSGLSLPSTGIWRLDVLVGEKPYGSVIVEVN
jgi:hypothetical protein